LKHPWRSSVWSMLVLLSAYSILIA
jgi:hypothetical protein